MVAGCGNNCIKYLLFFFNIIFFLFGLCLVAAGAYALIMANVVGNESDAAVKETVKLGAIIFLIAGVILVVICFFGCCGAIKEVKCLLGTYAVLLLLVIICELVIIVRLFMIKDLLKTPVAHAQVVFAANVESYTGDPGEDKSVDYTQQKSKCCGANSWEDFKDKADNWRHKGVYKVPLSCCKLKTEKTENIDLFDLEDPDCYKNPTEENSYIGQSCNEIMVSVPFLALIFNIVIGVAFGLMALEIIGIIFSICLIRAIGDVRAVPV